MIAIASDHAGFELKQTIIKHFEGENIAYVDYGCYNYDSCDYPIFAYKVAHAVANNECDSGILICGTGIGMSMAANKVDGVRAAVCTDHMSTKYTRLHNDANVLCLGSRITAPQFALELVDIFNNTPFEGGKHKKRIDMVQNIKNEEF